LAINSENQVSLHSPETQEEHAAGVWEPGNQQREFGAGLSTSTGVREFQRRRQNGYLANLKAMPTIEFGFCKETFYDDRRNPSS
jgi:hypothetical protein